MQILLGIVVLVIGLIFLMLGGRFFVDSLLAVARKTKIPHIILGATVSSFATTLPELIVGVISATKGVSELAVGNSIGSMLSNIALVSGLSITLLPIKYNKSDNIKFLFLFLTWVFIFIFGINLTICWLEGIFLIILFLLFLLTNLMEAFQKLKLQNLQITSFQKKISNKQIKKNKKQSEKITKKLFKLNRKNKLKDNLWLLNFVILLCGAAISGGAFLLVEGATKFALYLNIPEAVIGLTIVAFGTSIPDLVTTILLVKRKTPSLALGNLLGSSIINGSLILGIVSLINLNTGILFAYSDLIVTMPVLLMAILLLFIPLSIKKKSSLYQGILLMTIYSLYMVYLIISTSLGIFL